LRYYDRIGVLKPAYTDPNTSYRYYAFSQLKIAEVIRLCLELGIPLNQLDKLMENSGKIHLTRLLEIGKELGELKVHTILNGLKYIDYLQQEIQKNDRLLPCNTPTSVDVPNCHFLLEQIGKLPDDKYFYETLSALYVKAAEQGHKVGFKYGLFYKYRADEVERYQFIDILSPSKNSLDDVVTIPAGKYIVRTMEQSKIDQAPEIFPEIFETGQELLIVETELITGLYDVEKPSYELRCSVPNAK
jgi:DNA-binding transcriptional MerR regulator